MAIEIDAGDGSLAEAQAGAAVAGDELAHELKEIGVVADGEDPFRFGVPG